MLTRLGAALSILLTSATIAAAQLTVVATTGMIADTARQIGGDHVQVRALMGPGVDPHAFRQTRSDIVAMTRADLILWHGLYLEAQMEDVLQDLASKVPVVAVGDAVPMDARVAHDDYQNRFDPHVWMDVALWSECVAYVAQELGTLDASSSEDYQGRAVAYRKQLAELDSYIKEVIGTVPAEQRYLVTAHDAFGYFAEAYDIEVKAIQGISTDSQAAISDINSQVDFIVEKKVPAIFVESSVSPKNIEAVIEGCSSRGWTLKVGAELYSDAMGEPGTYEGTYIGMMDHNATKIARALGGEAPERGWQGRLSETSKH